MQMLKSFCKLYHCIVEVEQKSCCDTNNWKGVLVVICTDT